MNCDAYLRWQAAINRAACERHPVANQVTKRPVKCRAFR